MKGIRLKVKVKIFKPKSETQNPEHKNTSEHHRTSQKTSEYPEQLRTPQNMYEIFYNYAESDRPRPRPRTRTGGRVRPGGGGTTCTRGSRRRCHYSTLEIICIITTYKLRTVVNSNMGIMRGSRKECCDKKEQSHSTLGGRYLFKSMTPSTHLFSSPFICMCASSATSGRWSWD